MFVCVFESFNDFFLELIRVLNQGTDDNIYHGFGTGLSCMPNTALHNRKKKRRLIPVFCTVCTITLLIYTHTVFMGALLILEVKKIKCLMTMCKHGADYSNCTWIWRL